MPTWKLHKGESKTFEGTVLIATLAGASPTNYDITNATLGFDVGSTLGNWMIRTDSVWGSLGTNVVYNGDMGNGTSFWTVYDQTYSATYNVFSGLAGTSFPYPHSLHVSQDVGTYCKLDRLVAGSRSKMVQGTYGWGIAIRHLGLGVTLQGSFNSFYVGDMGSSFGTFNPISGSLWKEYYGLNVCAIPGDDADVNIQWRSSQLGILRTTVLTDIWCKRQVATSQFTILTGSMGVYRWSFVPADTENLTATSYYFDIWLRTSAGNEYTLTVGTLQLLPVVGTF